MLLNATRGALRLRVEGRSTARGSLPSWLASAADFDLVGIESGSTVLLLESPSLAEAVPGMFQQQHLFHPINPSDSGFGLMEESLREASAGRSDTELYDQPLLSTFRGFANVLASGVSSVEITNGEKRPHVVIDHASIAEVDRLIKSTPEPHQVKISGKLDTIRHSDRMFTLILDEGKSVKGVADGVAAEQLALLFGETVVVSGTAVFRPSGALLRVEADRIDRAGPDAALWTRVPAPLFQVMNTAGLRRPQGPKSGVNAIIGGWPGDEDDEAIASALRELS